MESVPCEYIRAKKKEKKYSGVRARGATCSRVSEDGGGGGR